MCKNTTPFDVMHSRATVPVFPVVYWDSVLLQQLCSHKCFLRNTNGGISFADRRGRGMKIVFVEPEKDLIFKKGDSV